MILDRALQLEILTVLSEHYPENVGDLNSILKKEPRVFEANINYLSEHDLVDIHVERPLSSTSYSHNQRITSRGLDFLSDDGGLGAILGVVTVRLHEDTVKGLLEAKLESADLPEEEKRPLLQAVRELPAEATKHLTMKLLDLGADNLPRAIELVRSLMS